MEKRRIRRDLITFFKFLNQSDNTDCEQYSMRCTDWATRGHHMKLSKELVRKDIKNYFYSITVMDECNTLSDEIVNDNSIQKFWKLNDGREGSRDTPQLPYIHPTHTTEPHFLTCGPSWWMQLASWGCGRPIKGGPREGISKWVSITGHIPNADLWCISLYICCACTHVYIFVHAHMKRS